MQAYYNEAYDSALYYSNSLKIKAEEQKSDKYQVLSGLYTAKALAAQNKIKEAFDKYFASLKLSRKVNETKTEGIILDDIGLLYFEQKNYIEARRFFNESILHKQKAGDSVQLANTLLNIATLYRRLNEFDSSAVLLQKARNIAFAKKDPVLLGHYHNAQATHFFNLFIHANNINSAGGDTAIWDRKFLLSNLRDSAELYWQKALALWKSKENKLNRINPLFNLGYLYHSKKNFSKAVEFYQAAKSIMDSQQMQSQKATVYGNMAEVYYDMKNYREAANYLRKVIEIKDSLWKDEIKMYSIKLDRQYQLENKNKTILEQELELARKNARIDEQQKRIYISVLLFIILLFIVVGIVVYGNFNKRVARNVEKAKEKFFANIMHEVRTPLSMIQAPLKTLKPKIQDEEGKYYINLAEKNVVRLNELINQMLDLSKLDSTSYKLSSSVGNLDLLLKEITTTYHKLALEKAIDFVSEINYNNTLLVFDKDALEKIIGNLLSNAIKYTSEKGTVGITVNCEPNESFSRLNIEVWDTGIGIRAEEQSKIFNRFFRSERSATKVTGVGIGLSLVKELVDAFGGKITVTSEINKGTRFAVQLDLKYPEQATVPVLSALEQSKSLILLIEDDEDILEFVSSYLQGKNYEIVKAKNGNVAKALLKNITPDLIVTDLMMDELDGLSFIKLIKSDKGLNHIPVIVLSAKSSGPTRVEVLASGAQVFMTKPFLPEELNSVISNQLALISTIRKEFKTKVETSKKDQTAEEKFTSTEPYTQKLFDLIFKNLDNSELSVEMLADLMATNRSHFQRKIKTLTGYSPSEIIKLIRLEKSREFLLAKKGNITEVAYMCGFSSQSYFTKCFTQHFGSSPTQINSNLK